MLFAQSAEKKPKQQIPETPDPEVQAEDIDTLEIPDSLAAGKKPKKEYYNKIYWQDFTLNRPNFSISQIDSPEIIKSHSRDIEEILEYNGRLILRKNYPGANSENQIFINGFTNRNLYTSIDNIELRTAKMCNIPAFVLPIDLIDAIDISNGPFASIANPYFSHGGLNYGMMRYEPGITYTDFNINLANYDREAIAFNMNVNYLEPLELQVYLGKESSRMYVYGYDLDDYQREKYNYGIYLGYRYSKMHKLSAKTFQSDFNDFYFDRLRLNVIDFRSEGRFSRILDYMANARYEAFEMKYKSQNSDSQNVKVGPSNEVFALDIRIKPHLFSKLDTNDIANVKKSPFRNPTLYLSFAQYNHLYQKNIFSDGTEEEESFSIEGYIAQSVKFGKLSGDISLGYCYGPYELSGIKAAMAASFEILDGLEIAGGYAYSNAPGLSNQYNEATYYMDNEYQKQGNDISLGLNFDRLGWLDLYSEYFIGKSDAAFHDIPDGIPDEEYLKESNVLETNGIRTNFNIKPLNFLEVDLNHEHFLDENILDNYLSTRLGFDFFLFEGRFQITADIHGQVFSGLEQAYEYSTEIESLDEIVSTNQKLENAHMLNAHISGEYWGFELYAGMNNLTSQKLTFFEMPEFGSEMPFPMPLPRYTMPADPYWQVGINWKLID